MGGDLLVSVRRADRHELLRLHNGHKNGIVGERCADAAVSGCAQSRAASGALFGRVAAAGWQLLARIQNPPTDRLIADYLPRSARRSSIQLHSG
jgi:hypothetical protein